MYLYNEGKELKLYIKGESVYGEEDWMNGWVEITGDFNPKDHC